MRVLAAEVVAVSVATVAWSSAEAVDVQIQGFYDFGCVTPDGEMRKPKFGDVDGIYFTGLPAERKPCLETIDRMIYSCAANTTFISHDLNDRFPVCLRIFERQASRCVRHFQLEQHKCYAGDTLPPAQTTAEPDEPEVEPADLTMWAAKRSNMRSGPGTDHAKVGLLEIGDEVQVTGETGDWLRIEAPGGGDAFVWAPLLTDEAPSRSSAAAGRETARALDIPDKATRERVADWWDLCTKHIDIRCDLFNAVIRELGQPCRELTGKVARTVTTPPQDAVREAERYLDPSARIDEEGRSNLISYLRTCVTAYAAAFDSGSVESAAQAEDEPAAVASKAPAAERGPLHGSITFSQEADGGYAWGIAWSFDNHPVALAESLDKCREYGGRSCTEVGWFQDACGALAIGDGNGYGAGWGDTVADAERDALSQCRAANENCRVEVARCSQSQEAGGKGRTVGKTVTIAGFSSSCISLGSPHTFEIPRQKFDCTSLIASAIAACLEWECDSGSSPSYENRQCANHFKDEGIQKCGLSPQDAGELGVDY